MTRRSYTTPSASLPASAQWLGLAGLLPQILLAAVRVSGPAELDGLAVGLGLSYSALILSFVGGIWWGIAARSDPPVATWIWWAAIAPSLIAFGAIGAVLTGYSPQPSLILIGASLIAALGVDYALVRSGLCPHGWLRLRLPLAIGLGGLTMLLAALSQ